MVFNNPYRYLERVMGGIVSETSNPDIYKKYKKYLKEYGL